MQSLKLAESESQQVMPVEPFDAFSPRGGEVIGGQVNLTYPTRSPLTCPSGDGWGLVTEL